MVTYATGDEQIRAELPAMLAKMKGHAIHMAGRHGAEDLLQQTAMRALSNAHQFTPGTSFAGWFYTILRNEYVTVKRRTKPSLHTSFDDVPQESCVVREVQSTHVYLAEVDRLIDRIHPAHGEVMRRVAIGQSYDEVADQLGVSIGTVKSRLWRARRQIEAAVA